MWHEHSWVHDIHLGELEGTAGLVVQKSGCHSLTVCIYPCVHQVGRTMMKVSIHFVPLLSCCSLSSYCCCFQHLKCPMNYATPPQSYKASPPSVFSSRFGHSWNFLSLSWGICLSCDAPQVQYDVTLFSEGLSLFIWICFHVCVHRKWSFKL